MAQKDVASTFRAALELLQKWRLDKRLDADATLAGRSDTMVASQRAVKDYIDSRDPLPGMITQPQGSSEAWPVGSVFIGVVATDPALLLGYGTWAAFGAGRVLVGLDSGDTDFDTVEETGGAKTQAISAHAGTAVADHADHTHNVTSNVTVTTTNIDTTAGATAVGTALTNNAVTSTGASATLSHTVTQPSAHTDLSVVQPYCVVYFWKRTG